ncbi:MAG: peroxiredoxin [Candidatus Kerfeldbacteria bacterium]|nr:peroxiredoxin [Candidatus Kerfeldbacteria bacterium]
MIQVGQPAPDFRLEGIQDPKNDYSFHALSDYRGKWVVFFFYPADFTFICPTEIVGFSERYNEFVALNAVVLGASTDSKHSHHAWIEREGWGLNYPLLADLTKQVSRAYGVLLEDKGEALRGTFIIDPDGILRWMVVSDNNVGRSVSETLRALEALQTGERCGVDWKPGEKTLGKPT